MILWRIQPGAEEILVTVDDAVLLETDLLLYGDVYVKKIGESGGVKVCERLNPLQIDPRVAT